MREEDLPGREDEPRVDRVRFDRRVDDLRVVQRLRGIVGYYTDIDRPECRRRPRPESNSGHTDRTDTTGHQE
ncbi:hypothetical protein [Amycolatopsis sp. cmx-11-12]|uniref:hypothetical protein n=1 Tax=Amycolatopsis sp. cmx-11-12 TaxID=2785795 RepID=UPI003917E1F4